VLCLPGPFTSNYRSGFRRALASNKINLQAELHKKDIHTELRGLSLAGRPQLRDPYLTILSAGVTAALVGGAISRIIAAISGLNHSQMTERELQAAVDGNGHAIIDKGGNPVYNLAEKPGRLAPPEVSTTRLVAGKLLSFDVSTGQPAAKRPKAIAKKVATKKTTTKRSTKSVTRQKGAK
jgi:hypothetical protein